MLPIAIQFPVLTIFFNYLFLDEILSAHDVTSSTVVLNFQIFNLWPTAELLVYGRRITDMFTTRPGQYDTRQLGNSAYCSDDPSVRHKAYVIVFRITCTIYPIRTNDISGMAMKLKDVIHPSQRQLRNPYLQSSNTSSVCWNMNQRATKEREHPHKSLELSLLYFPSLPLMSLLIHLAPPSHKKKATNTPMSTIPEAMRGQLAWGSVSSPAAFCLSLAG